MDRVIWRGLIWDKHLILEMCGWNGRFQNRWWWWRFWHNMQTEADWVNMHQYWWVNCFEFNNFWAFYKTAKFFHFREHVLEILSQQEIGSFLIRDSTTHPGCYALSVKVPKYDNPTGISHYLVMRTERGSFRLKVCYRWMKMRFELSEAMNSWLDGAIFYEGRIKCWLALNLGSTNSLICCR